MCRISAFETVSRDANLSGTLCHRSAWQTTTGTGVLVRKVSLPDLNRILNHTSKPSMSPYIDCTVTYALLHAEVQAWKLCYRKSQHTEQKCNSKQ